MITLIIGWFCLVVGFVGYAAVVFNTWFYGKPISQYSEICVGLYLIAAAICFK